MRESPATPFAAGRPACTSCGLTRRHFLAASTLAAVVAVVESCSNALGIDGFNGAYGGPISVKLSSFSALANVGGVARVDGGSGAPTALVRTGTSTFSAFSMVCPHQQATIDISTGGFTCPNHGARFNTAGTWTGGQPTSSLRSYSTNYDAAGGTVLVNRPA